MSAAAASLSLLQRASGRFAMLRRLAIVLLVVMVAGCKVDLYSGLSESEANQMMALLMANGIPVSKRTAGEAGVTVSIDEEHMLRAIALLKDAGLPRSTRDSIGKVFQKSGIMSSPFEERVRYIYALGEEVAQTLSQIDGVVTARVHIVLPEAPQLGQAVKPSSAAVFIKHRPGVDLDFFTPQIRRLVSNAIEGLDYSAVTVVLVEAQPTAMDIDQGRSEEVEILPGIPVKADDAGKLWQILVGVGALVLLLLVGNISLGLAYWRLRRGRKSSDSTAIAQVEPS